jgi:hypothetical protein
MKSLDDIGWYSYTAPFNPRNDKHIHDTFSEAVDNVVASFKSDETLLEKTSMSSVIKALGVKPKQVSRETGDANVFLFGNGFIVEISSVEHGIFDVIISSKSNGGIVIKDMPLDDTDRCVARITAAAEILERLIKDGKEAIEDLDIDPSALTSEDFVGWVHNSYVVASEFKGIDEDVTWSVTPDEVRITATHVAPFSINFDTAIEAFKWASSQKSIITESDVEDKKLKKCFDVAQAAGNILGTEAVRFQSTHIVPWVWFEDMMFTITPSKIRSSAIVGCEIVDKEIIDNDDVGQPGYPVTDYTWNIDFGNTTDMALNVTAFIDWCSNIRLEMVNAAQNNPGWTVDKFSMRNRSMSISIQNNGTCLARSSKTVGREFHSIAEAIEYLTSLNEVAIANRR